VTIDHEWRRAIRDALAEEEEGLNRARHAAAITRIAEHGAWLPNRIGLIPTPARSPMPVSEADGDSAGATTHTGRPEMHRPGESPGTPSKRSNAHARSGSYPAATGTTQSETPDRL
jgi:hypothetical protein